MARTPTTLLDGQVLTAYSTSNLFSCSLAANSTGSFLFKSSISHILAANNGIQWATFSTQSLISPTASASVWGLDCITSGSLAGNLVFRAAISGLSNGFTMTQDGTSNIIYTFNDGILVCGGTAGTTSGVISAGTGFRINNAAASGNVLRGNGTNFVSAALVESDITGLVSDLSSINSSLATKLSAVVQINEGGTDNTSYTTNGIIFYNGSNFNSTGDLIWDGIHIRVGSGVYFSSNGIADASSNQFVVTGAGITVLDNATASGGDYNTYVVAGSQSQFRVNYNGGTSSLGFFGFLSSQAGAYTGLGTTSKTIATAVTTTGAINIAPFGYSTAAQADAIVSAINALIKNMCAVIGDLRGYGLIN